MENTIFRADKGDPASRREEKERHHFIHYIFKLKYFLPFLKWARRLMKKVLIKDMEDIPKRPENTTIRILADLFSEKEMKKFYYTFKGYDQADDKPNGGKFGIDNCWKLRETQNWYWVPRFCVRFMLTWIMQDTHYRAFFEYQARRFQQVMNEVYNPEIEQVVPFYIWKFDGFLLYFLQWKAIIGGKSVTININPQAFKWRDERPTKERENMLINTYVAQKINRLEPKLKENFMIGLENFIMKLSQAEIASLSQYSWQNDEKEIS